MGFKYIRIGINAFKSRALFGLDPLIKGTLDCIMIIVFSFIWKNFEYFFVVFLLNIVLPDVSILRNIDEEIRSGKLSLYITLPIEYDLKTYFSYIFYKTSGFIRIIIVLLFGIFMKINLLRLIVVFPFFILSTLLSFYIYFLFSPISFKTESSWGFAFIFERILKYLLSGFLIPTYVLREYVKFYDLLPFKYMVGFCAEVYLRGVKISDLFVQLTWTVLFLTLSRYLWKLSIKEYQSYSL